jgi:hypothetical protein
MSNTLGLALGILVFRNNRVKYGLSDPLAVGAVVTVKFSGRALTGHVRGGSGYLSHFHRRILLQVDSGGAFVCSECLLIGQQEVFRNLRPNRTNLLV